MIDVLEGLRAPRSRRRLAEHIEHRATIASLRTLLADGGFAVVRTVERRHEMRFADGSALFNHYFIKLGFLDAWKKVVPGGEPESFARLESRLNEIAQAAGDPAYDSDGLC